MTRVALFGVVIATAVGAAVILAGQLTNLAEPPNEAVTSRFPEGWESAPVVEYRKPLPWLSAVSRMSNDEFIGAVTAIERLRPPPPADGVFNDAQIASIKARLNLRREQEPYWREVEASLRNMVWDRSRGDRPRLEPNSLKRFKEAAAPFVATLNARQQAEIQALANIVGLRFNREGVLE